MSEATQPPKYIQERVLIITLGVEKDGTYGFVCDPVPPIDHDYLTRERPTNPLDKIYYDAFIEFTKLAANIIERHTP